MKYLSRPWFTVVFSIAYIPIFAMDWPLFVYYPLLNEIHFTALTRNTGPAMHWYGYVATAAIVAFIVSLLLKDRWIPPRLVAWLWLAPVMTMASSLYLLKDLFI